MSITADEEGRLSMSPIEHHEKEVANSLHQTLSERGKRYGDFTDNARIAEAINQAMLSGLGWQRMRPVQREALRIIASKISRMCSCDPEYVDNWHDIAGYATLVEERCQAKEPAKTRWPNPSPPEFSEGVERALRQAPIPWPHPLPHGCAVGDEKKPRPPTATECVKALEIGEAQAQKIFEKAVAKGFEPLVDAFMDATLQVKAAEQQAALRAEVMPPGKADAMIAEALRRATEEREINMADALKKPSYNYVPLPDHTEENTKAVEAYKAERNRVDAYEQQAKPLGEGGSFIGTSAGMYAQDAKLPGTPLQQAYDCFPRELPESTPNYYLPRRQ